MAEVVTDAADFERVGIVDSPWPAGSVYELSVSEENPNKHLEVMVVAGRGVVTGNDF